MEDKLRQNRAAYTDGVYYYNIGTMHIKKGEIGLGRYGLEKALTHGFQSPQVIHNLDLVREKIQVEELEWIPSMVGPRIEYVDQVLPEIYPAYAATFEPSLPEGGAELLQLFSKSYLKLNTALAERAPWTLAHQDYRVENMLFGNANNDEVTVIDWQGIGRGPGAYDLAYLLGGSMETEMRRSNERDLVTAYHTELCSNGVEGYEFESAWSDYGFAHLIGGLATSVFAGGTLDLNNDRGKELIAMMSERHVTAALDHGGLNRIPK